MKITEPTCSQYAYHYDENTSESKLVFPKKLFFSPIILPNKVYMCVKRIEAIYIKICDSILFF